MIEVSSSRFKYGVNPIGIEESKMRKGFVALGAVSILAIVLGAFAYTNLNRPSNPNTGTNQNQSGQQFVGSKNSDVYHYPSCTWAQRIKASNQIWFSSSQDARNHGYRPCEICHPP
jgi:hypothetical protein